MQQNNGWIKLITMEDLPTKSGTYITIDLAGNRQFTKLLLSPGLLQQWMVRFTHWTSIENIPAPVR